MHVVVDVTVAALHDELPLIVTHAHPRDEQSAYCVSSAHEQEVDAVNFADLTGLAAKTEAKRRAKMITYVFIIILRKIKNLNQDMNGDG